MKKSALVLLLSSFFILASCSHDQETTNELPYDQDSQQSITTTTTNTDTTMKEKETPMQLEQPKAGEEIAILKTNMGDLKMRFFPDLVPETVKNFKELAKKGYYDGIIFHRVIKDFMIQGGDPTGTGTGGESYLGDQSIKDEFSKELTHHYGAVSMANAGPNTGSSQFFIVQNKEGTHFLDGRHAVFAQVYDGVETVEKIAAVETDVCGPYERRLGCDKPLKDVVIESIEFQTL